MESSFVKGSILSPYMIGEGTVYKRKRERERVRCPPLVVVVITTLLLRGLVCPIAQSA